MRRRQGGPRDGDLGGNAGIRRPVELGLSFGKRLLCEVQPCSCPVMLTQERLRPIGAHPQLGEREVGRIGRYPKRLAELS